ncbi:hypothetical protein KC887_00555 [Candidatus Kaiserbacteria bacterium]|nr:hypothetical protein [Candidatus Kaiserbacteria bacterium]
MIECTLTRADGQELARFPFPTEAREVTYKQYTRFEDAYQAKEKWLQNNAGASVTEPRFVKEYIQHVARIVEAFTGIDNVLEAQLGDYVQHVQQFFGDDVAGFTKELQSVEQTVFTLYANIWRTMASYKKHVHTSEAYHFQYKGKVYRLKSAYRDAITGQLRFDSLSVAQGIEVLEAWRVYEQAKGNDIGNRFLFTTIVTLIACLALEDGQSFPDDEKTIQRWVSDRVVYFQDINMEIALNVRDFFLNTTNPFLRIPNTNGSSGRQLAQSSARAKPGKNMKRRTLRHPRA